MNGAPGRAPGVMMDVAPSTGIDEGGDKNKKGYGMRIDRRRLTPAGHAWIDGRWGHGLRLARAGTLAGSCDDPGRGVAAVPGGGAFGSLSPGAWA